MRALQICHRSACAATVSLKRVPIHPSPLTRTTTNQHFSQQNEQNSSSIMSGLSSIASAAAAGVLLIAGMTVVAQSDTATLSASSYVEQKQDTTQSMDSLSLSLQPSSLGDLSIGKLANPNQSLFDEVAQGDPNAVQTLSRMITDTSTHIALLDQNVIQALVTGLSTARETGEAARPIQLSIIRMLADLAEHNATNSQFSIDSTLPQALCPILSDIAKESAEPWSHWLKRQFSFSSSSPLEMMSEASKKEQQQQSQDILLLDLDINLLSSKNTTITPVDLDAGIMYHTLRCVANIALHTHLHSILLSSPVLPHICKLLCNLHNYHPDASSSSPSSAASHHYTDLLRFSTMAVSALAKSAPNEVVANYAHIPIISLTSQVHDTTIQTFAAGGIRNLARHPAESISSQEKDRWRVHREIVVAGVADALSVCMRSDASPHSKSFAVSSFSDLMTSGHHKAHLIRRRLSPVYSYFVNLLKDRNALVFRAVSKCLNMIFNAHAGNENSASSIVPEELAEGIAEQSGLFMNATFKQHNLLATKAVGAMCNEKSVTQRMMDKGLLEFLRVELRSAQGEYWEKCTGIVGNISEWEEYRNLITSSGMMKDILRRPCIENDGMQISKLLANLARDSDARVGIAHNGLRILLTSLTSKNSEAVNQGARALYNLSLEGFSRVIVSQNGGIVPLINSIAKADSKNDTDVSTRRFAIGALAEISESLVLATTLIEADIVGSLLKAAKDDSSVHRDVARTFAQMSQLTEVHGSFANSGAAEWLSDIISKNGGSGELAGEVLQYAMVAICNLTFSPGVTRDVLISSGVLRTLSGIASSGMSAPLAGHGARQALSNLRGKEKPTMLPSDGIPKIRRPA